MGETQHVYTTRDIESGVQDKGLSFEPFGKKGVGEIGKRLLDSPESQGQSGSDNGRDFVSNKDKEPHHQREAVIRPQKAGRIDFKSLNHHPRFSNASPWGAAKGAPPSPPGRSRARDKGSRRSGKSERGHPQLYRLAVSNARPNPTIGIAYPQQKITPPKKVEADRGPVLGSYRFHVPSLPERELEFQEDGLSFARCFSEAASGHVSSNYTSQAAAACPGHGSKVQPLVSVPHDNPGPKGTLPFLEFQANGSNLWSSPDKGYIGASNGLPAPKPSTHCLGPLSFQYPFSPLHSSAAGPFQDEAPSQDYVDVSLATSQASHGAFAFHSSSRDWKEEVLGNGGSYDPVATESRTYGLAAAPQPAPFLLPQAAGHLPCYKGRHELSTDHNGAISPPGAIEPVASTFQENQAVFPPSLHASSMPKLMGKRPSLLKDSVASQRILDAGSSLRRNTLQVSLPQLHFQNKASSGPSAGRAPSSSVPFEKSLPPGVQAHPRLLQAWEGGKKTYSPTEQSSAGCPGSGGSQLSLGHHLGLEPRQHARKAWQHLHLPAGLPGQNRSELPRKLASQKQPFPLGTSEWDGGRKRPKSPASYAAKTLGAEERRDPVAQGCSSASSVAFEGSKEAESSKSRSFFFNVSPTLPSIPSHHPSSPNVVLPPSALAASPNGSPLPSPSPNLNSSCSSLSPASSSPTGHGCEDEAVLPTSTFFHHQGHPKDPSKAFHTSELLGSCAGPYQTANPVKAFHQEFLYKAIPADSHFQKSNTEPSRRWPEGFESELPPPPYPYSSRHLLASSLSSTSLDQLDVFLTCKQCDQNFSNLSSFLEHRQFCSPHVILQGQAKDSSSSSSSSSSRGAEVKKQHPTPPESAKHAPSGLGMLLSPDPHLQPLALSKTVDFLVDVEGKGESRDDPLKVNQLNGLPGTFLPLNPSDLEIDDAKLDSLITETLDRLGYQSDNPEIDSSFMDAFVDEELASVKVTSAGTPFKAKENLALAKKAKHVAVDEGMKMLNCCDNHPGGELAKSRASKQHKERGTNWLSDLGEERLETLKNAELARNKVLEPTLYEGTEEDAGIQLKIGKKSSGGSFLPAKPGAQPMPALRQTKKPSCASPVSELKPDGTHKAAESTALSKKDAKKRKPQSSSWSKELIHKIVQQKNKLHKLHPENSKAVSLSLLTSRRLLPETKDDKFGEYEYISESDGERVEYAKRHCRRKLRSRFGGRLRSGLKRKDQGRGGREKEPIWRHGPRRGQEEPKRSAKKELERNDGARTRGSRRSRSQSSRSSCQSGSLSSETSNSPQSTERGDSDTERESERRKRCLPSPKGGGPLPVPEKETVRKRHGVGFGLSGKPTKVNSPKTQPAGSPKFQKHNANVPLDTGIHGDEGLLESRGKPRHREASPGKGPTILLGPEGSDQDSGTFRCDGERPRLMAKGAEWRSDATGDPHGPQYSAGEGGLLRNHGEEPPGSPSPGQPGVPKEESARYEPVDVKELKKQKELILPISCFSDHPAGVGMSGKEVGTLLEAANAFYGCKELCDSYETPALFSGPPATEPSQDENVYLYRGDFEVPSLKKKHHDTLSCDSDNAPSKVSSPLHFDSSPMFGDFPIAEFDANLYDSVASSKDNYIPFECANHQLGKIVPFDQQYSSFLSEKDWTLMAPPVLPEDLPQIHRLPVEKPTPKRYSTGVSPLPLSERLSDYNMHCVGLSDDELEIKRLVTELESQLQASKLNMEAPDEDQASVNHAGMETKKSTHEFLSLRLDQEEDGKGLFLIEAEYENANLLSTKTFGCENAVREKTLLATLDTKYGNPNDPWPCAGSFSPLQSATDLILVGPFSSQGGQEKMAEHLKDIEISAEADFGGIKDASARIMPDPCLEDLSDGTGASVYPEHVIQSPDSIFPKSLEDSELSPHENLPGVFPKLPSEEKTLDGTRELESYGHEAPYLEPKFGLEDADTLESDGNVSSTTQSKDPEGHPSKKLERTTLFQSNKDEHLGQSEETGSQTVCQTLTLKAKADNGNNPPFDALTFSKEIDGEVMFESTTQEKTANPLQQLQLFVARTAKNNEEELVISSLPAQHPAAHLPTCRSIAPDPEEKPMDKEQNEEANGGPVLEKKKETLLKTTGKADEPPPVPTNRLSEPEEQAEDFHEWASDVSKDLAPLSPAQYSHVSQQQHLKAECLEGSGHAACADGISLEHRCLSALSNLEVASVLREKRTQQSQVTGQAEGGQEEKTLAFRDHRKSPLIPGSSEKNTPQGVLPAVLQVHVARCTSWNKACCRDQELGTAKAHQVEDSEIQRKPLQHVVSSIPICSPETEGAHLLQRNNSSSRNSSDSTGRQDLEKPVIYYAETSQAGFSLEVGSADQKKVLKTDSKHATGYDFGGISSEERTGQIPAASQQVAFLACSSPSPAERTAVPQQSPSEEKACKAVLPSSPTCHAISHRPSDTADPPAEGITHDLMAPEKKVPLRCSSSPCSSKAAPAQTGSPLNVQMKDCASPGMLPLKSKMHPEKPSKEPADEDSGMFSLRDGPSGSQAASLHDFLINQLPSGVDSVAHRGALCDKNGSFTSKPPGAKGIERDRQEGGEDPSQPGYIKKDVAVVVLTKMADASVAHPKTNQLPRRGSSGDPQDVGNRSHDLENEDSALNEDVKTSPDGVEQEGSRGQRLRSYSKTGQSKARKRKGLQIACDICSLSFRSKTGLMRHKAVKHQKKKDSVLLPENSLEKALKTSEGLPKRSTKSFIKEKSSSSDIAKAVGQPFPKSSRRTRKATKAQIQESTNKELNGLNVVSLDQTHAFQKTGEMQPISSQRETLGGPEIQLRKKTSTGKFIPVVNTKRSSNCAGRKIKEKPRQAKLTSDKNEVPASFLQESEIPTVPCNAIGNPDDHILATIPEEAGSSSAEQANLCLPLLPQPLAKEELEDTSEKAPSARRTAGPQLLPEAESCRKKGEEAELEQKQPTQESWPTALTKEGENEPDKKPASKEGLLEEMNHTTQNSPFVHLTSPNKLSQPCHSGPASEEGSPKQMSEKALDADAPYFVDAEPWRMEELQPPNESPADHAVEPDLPSLFDDDSTFSQLFPRNDQFTRRKCTRVYGKRSKKPKPIAEILAKPEGSPDIFAIRMASDLGESRSFCVTQEHPCEFDTISIGDALMLDMCHGGKAMSGDLNSRPTTNTILQLDSGQKEEDHDLKNGSAFLGPKSPTGSLPCLKRWSELEKTTGNNSADRTLHSSSVDLAYGPPAVEGSPQPPDLEEESYSPKEKASSAFHTIDMEMLDMKFEARGMCFCSPGGDPLCPTGDSCILGFKPTSLLPIRPIKNKLEEGKPGKTRGDLNLKNKDKQYKCKVCFQWFLTLGELDFHKLTHNPSPPPTCYMCVQRKFSSREQLRDHLKEKHAKNKAGLWACGMCLKEISEVWMYNEHLREHATQFARKGQTQKSVLGLPGCFGEHDAAVSHFLNSIMCQKPSRLSRHADGGNGAPPGRESKCPKELLGREAVLHKDLLEIPLRVRPATASLRAPAVPSPEPVPRVEGAQKAAPIHPECKDPSRDCHHCGKQFPKPFKLQRHLVVHSLQKIFLCHKCPVFYQETKELRGHLSQEHGVAKETDIKHTTLYACELCADVMHVIKKSFICSACNYTFSKKEQYDRHMEKHRVGSSKTFRFRGVMRPGAWAKHGDQETQEQVQARAGAPAAKKKKVYHHSNAPELALPGHSGGAQLSQGDSRPLLSAGEALSTATSLAVPPSAQTPMKTEGLGSDPASLLAERGRSLLPHRLPTLPLEPQDGPGHMAVLSPETWAAQDNPTLPLQSPDALSIDLADTAAKKTAAHGKLSPAPLPEKHNQEHSVAEKATLSRQVEHHAGAWESPSLEDPASQKPELSPGSLGSTECKWSPELQWENNPSLNGTATQDSVSKLPLPETHFHELPLKDKTSSPGLNRPAEEVPSKARGGQANAENTPGVHCSLGSAEDLQKGSLWKDKAFPEMDAAAPPQESSPSVGIKEAEPNVVRPAIGLLQGEPVSAPSKSSHPNLNKLPERLVANLHSKRPKELKAPHRGSPVSRENIQADGSKRRKARPQDPAKGDHLKKGDWPTAEALALSPRRSDAQSNKLTPKLKAAVTDSQLRKLGLGQDFQKKAELCQANGELHHHHHHHHHRRKKETLGSKALHPLLAKDPSNLSRRRAVQGAKFSSPHSYRTAESQTHLLNQLFGQKLTSFKIPLRRDTSE